MARRQKRAAARARSETQPIEKPAAVTVLPDSDPGIRAIRVLTENEAAKALGVSNETLRRMGPAGPMRLQLSARRVGYRLADLTAWLDARARAQGAEHAEA